ncbi:flagellar export protein FliJ [Candidatus Termititenax persephonae]|uniref:Flagellar FliJ protein n=1 Tax=Candidatus Termititenax persephonae TaxID=2218525 RepID=A0A388TFE1_9BACT|nr:flagellar export protein FliJ [Candidatus Termititenax persephonae]
MKKPKKSKRFEYNLKVVLKVREIYEKLEKEKFAEAQRKYREELEREQKMKDYEMQQQRTLKSGLQGSIDFASIMHRQNFLKKYKQDVVEQENKTKEADQHKEEQRERLVKSMKDRKILEKDREHKKDAWKRLMDREATKFLDEIATAKHFQKMTERKLDEAKRSAS